MDFIIEFVIELILEGSYELTQSKKTPKWLRYPLIIFFILFFVAVLGLIFVTGYLTLSENIFLGVALILIGIAFIVAAIIKYKHLYHKLNPLSEESKLWQKFIEQICPKKLKDLNEIQKNAVLCFYYDYELNIGGHVCYFDNYRKVKNEDLLKSLGIVANKKYVNNLKDAIAHGKEDNYQKTDQKYQDLSPCLTEYLEEYVIKHKDEIFTEN